MIGVLKRIIVFQDGGSYVSMLNPVIIKPEISAILPRKDVSAIVHRRKPYDMRKSRYPTWIAVGKRKLKPMRAFVHRLFSTSWIIVTVY